MMQAMCVSALNLGWDPKNGAGKWVGLVEQKPMGFYLQKLQGKPKTSQRIHFWELESACKLDRIESVSNFHGRISASLSL